MGHHSAEELKRRVRAARGYAGWMDFPESAKGLSLSVSTLKRYDGDKFPTGRRREDFLRRVADKTGLPIEFFSVDFARLPELATSADQPAAEPEPDRLGEIEFALGVLVAEARGRGVEVDLPTTHPQRRRRQ